MIVLGIAALILAGVLIAVPALQRNQRNNNRRADIQFLQSQIVTYQGNNQGDMPENRADVIGSITNNDGDSTFYATGANSWDVAGDWHEIDTDGTSATDVQINGNAAANAAAIITDADANSLWLDNGNTATGANPGDGNNDPLPDNEHFDVFIGFQCEEETLTNPANNRYPGANTFVNVNGLARNFAIVYRLEGANIWYCQDNA